jgi:hypothetical protein
VRNRKEEIDQWVSRKSANTKGVLAIDANMHGGAASTASVSLAKWANREIKSKAEADEALDDLKATIRAGTFDERGLDPPRSASPLTFSKFADVYEQRHVLAKGLALSTAVDYRLKPLIERFGNRLLAEIKTADIEDFVARFEEAACRQRHGGPNARPSINQSYARIASTHVELGSRARIHRSNAVPTGI